jgi:hypothetical protein
MKIIISYVNNSNQVLHRERQKDQEDIGHLNADVRQVCMRGGGGGGEGASKL